ncbi:NUDIX hydrolase [Kineococcus gynurae]|uniref:NUDIX hydrolase n=1 Tax=Kineococcus gynurae TaxID=452979 RepID=A0ABV5LTD5_9ACTN
MNVGARPGGELLQRVVVHVRAEGRDPASPLPWAVLRHGETPGVAAGRALGVPGAVDVGALLDVRDATRHDAGLEVHTVHLVLAVGEAHADPVDPTDLLLVADAAAAVEPAERDRLRPAGVPGEAVVRQRLAAYAVVVSEDDRLLLTRLSTRTPSPGRWTLPGGGVDHGEHPVRAAVREVHEETGMRVGDVRLAEVGSEHFTGRSPRGVLEDFHAVRILVTATAEAVRVPEVLDVGGSTDEARWVPLAQAASIGLVGVAHRGLAIAQRLRT